MVILSGGLEEYYADTVKSDMQNALSKNEGKKDLKNIVTQIKTSHANKWKDYMKSSKGVSVDTSNFGLQKELDSLVSKVKEDFDLLDKSKQDDFSSQWNNISTEKQPNWDSVNESTAELLIEEQTPAYPTFLEQDDLDKRPELSQYYTKSGLIRSPRKLELAIRKGEIKF